MAGGSAWVWDDRTHHRIHVLATLCGNQTPATTVRLGINKLYEVNESSHMFKQIKRLTSHRAICESVMCSLGYAKTYRIDRDVIVEVNDVHILNKSNSSHRYIDGPMINPTIAS